MIARPALTPLVLACLLLAMPCAGMAQTGSASSPVAPAAPEAPIYDSAHNFNRMTKHQFTSVEDDARPGEHFFAVAVRAFQKKEYRFAVEMYKVSASWAYKPAEYNLGVMYARGQGVPVDMPRALAWFVLAAERGDKTYAAAGNLINSKLTDAQFKQANAIFGQLRPVYGDETALVRAKARWAMVRAGKTGTRVGSLAGNLKVGGTQIGAVSASPANTAGSALRHVATGADEILGAGSVDGSIAYRQLVSSKNPYDPKFAWRPGHRTVMVGTLTPAGKGNAKATSKSSNQPTSPPANPELH